MLSAALLTSVLASAVLRPVLAAEDVTERSAAATMWFLSTLLTALAADLGRGGSEAPAGDACSLARNVICFWSADCIWPSACSRDAEMWCQHTT